MPYSIESRHLTEQPTAVVRATVANNDIGNWLNQAYRQVFGYLGRTGAQPAGPPFARYSMRDDTFEMEAGVPVASPADGEGAIHASTLPAGPAAVTVHTGRYEDLAAAYDALRAWQPGDPTRAALDRGHGPSPRTSSRVPRWKAGGTVKTTSVMKWIIGFILLLLLSACAAGPNPSVGEGPQNPGFWLGLWHGLILPATFVISLFADHVSIYEVRNSGHWYDFGFLLGAGGLALPGFLSGGRRGSR